MELKSATRYIGKILQGIDKKPFYVVGVEKSGEVFAIPLDRSKYLIQLAPWADYDEVQPTIRQYRKIIVNAFRFSDEYKE